MPLTIPFRQDFIQLHISCNWLSSQWRHNNQDGVSNHQPHGCLLNRLFTRRSKKHQSSASLALWGEVTGDRWIPRTNCQLRGKCFHLMTSSWYRYTSQLHISWVLHVQICSQFKGLRFKTTGLGKIKSIRLWKCQSKAFEYPLLSFGSNSPFYLIKAKSLK